MKILNLTTHRETYRVEVKHSILFETALGIAAYTYYDFHHTLEKPLEYWEGITKKISEELKEELQHVHVHNTWYAILQLLHYSKEETMEGFLDFLSQLSLEQCCFYCLPYLGRENEELRQRVATGDQEASRQLMKKCEEHKFFPTYISYIGNVNMIDLKKHMAAVFVGWYKEVVGPIQQEWLAILERDAAQKRSVQAHYSPEKFVEYATKGIAYQPEPFVDRVLLIPQYIYRPWNVEASLPGTKVFYYPVSDESVHLSEDLYAPPSILVHGYKALGDETRLRIVKLLSERDYSLQELHEKLSIPKSTLHHHLSLLRSARLVTNTSSKYELNRENVSSLQKWFTHFLERRTNEE
ncbi:ArsR/SmtB family transcription factor [Microbacteriaceae bacterium 4G12]